MFKIGDFSKLCQVPVSTLRYYANLGLLVPAQIDPQTGYRYYSVVQLSRLNRILVLQDLGFSLDQIAQTLHGDLALDEMRGMLRLKEAEVRQHIQAEQDRLARINARLRQLEGYMSDYAVMIKELPAHQVASARVVVPTVAEMGPRCQQMFQAVIEWVFQNQIRPAGPALSLYYNEEYVETNIDVETAFVIDGGSVGATTPHAYLPIQVRELPAVPQAACPVHRGSFDHLIDAFRAVGEWIEANGYTICGPSREVYLSQPGDEIQVTEVQYPVTKG